MCHNPRCCGPRECPAHRGSDSRPGSDHSRRPRRAAAPRPEVQLVDANDAAVSGVTVVVTDEVDEPTFRAVRAARVEEENRVVLMVTRLAEGDPLGAVEAGASSVLHRGEATPDSIIEAVCAASSGADRDVARSPRSVARLRRMFAARRAHAPRHPLPRADRTKGARCYGLSPRVSNTVAIGQRPLYSDRTVKNMIHDVTSRPNLRNRTHAIAYALRQGFI